MVTENDSATSAPNPTPETNDDVFARTILAMTEVRVLVGVDLHLEAVEIAVEGAPIPLSCIMAPKHALRLAHKLNRAVARIPGVTP